MPMQKYTPTQKDREIVAILSARGISKARIAKCLCNERTGRRLNERTLDKHFRAQLEDGAAYIASKVAAAVLDLVDSKHPQTVLAAARQYLGWGEEGATTLTVTAGAKADAMTGCEVVFRKSDLSRHTPEELAGDPLPGHSQPYSATTA